MPFNAERRYFSALRDHLDADVAAQYLSAVNGVIGAYNTTVRENRFTVGGAVEVFTVALMRSVGIDAHHYAAQESSGDILLPGNVTLSVKGTHTKTYSKIGLINKQGEGARTWSTATIFVRSGVGLVYGDPEMFPAEAISDKGDQLGLLGRFLRGHIENNPDLIIPMQIDYKPPTELAGRSKLQSVVVAHQIMDDLGLDLLKQHSE